MQTCPSCKSGRLQAVDLEPGLKARHCPHCLGHWLPFADYLPWVESGARIAEPVEAPVEASALFGELPGEAPVAAMGHVNGTTTALHGPSVGAKAKVKLCPECGRFLRRYHLGMGIEFEIDRCGGCAGMWCDAGKWPRLRAAGAHGRLHLLVSDSWQAKLKDEQLRKRQEDRVRAILGEADFERAREFKAWVDAHPHRATLRALLAEDFDERRPPSAR
jgi:Zn-finger nucleic acid-binding protein